MPCKGKKIMDQKFTHFKKSMVNQYYNTAICMKCVTKTS